MILVGVDGSRAALEAVGWAAHEAALREVPLTVAHAMPRWAYETESGRYAQVAARMRAGGPLCWWWQRNGHAGSNRRSA
ncbi:universal stress protein [Nonomuraea sp. B19D2]|uniref:universal stress protein n=1 Tax=Nonomuraea sp. B19D2 TaxID=3159561 RepID=UPI0032DB070C